MMPPDPSQGGRRPDLISTEVSEHVRSLISYAEEVANAVRAEAGQRAESRLREADEEAGRRLEDARREADALVDQRRRLISELSDRIVERGHSLLLQLEQADSLRRQFEEVMRTFGDVAHSLAAEAGGGTPGTEAPAVQTPSIAPPSPRTLPPQPPLGWQPPAPPEPAPAQPQEPPAQPVAQPPQEPGAPRDPATNDARPGDSEDQSEGGATAGLRDEDGARLVALQMAIAGSTRGEAAAHLQRTFQAPDLHRILDEVFGDGERRT